MANIRVYVKGLPDKGKAITIGLMNKSDEKEVN